MITPDPRTPSHARATQALLSLAVGDALGWPVEDRGGRVGGTASLKPRWGFESWDRKEGGRYGSHVVPIAAGDVSDDTQLALAVARSLSRSDSWWDHFTQVELPLWTVYERGGGGATKRAAQSWLLGRRPWVDEAEPKRQRYYEAGGNGTAMRCLPHCFADISPDELNNRLDRDALATHGHPFALIGSRLYGWAARWALGRGSPLRYGELIGRAIDAAPQWAAEPTDLPDGWLEGADHYHRGFSRGWEEALVETQRLLRIAQDGVEHGAVAVDHEVLESLGAFGRASGAGHVTAVAAIFLAARYLTQPREGLLTAAFARGADTDTLAAMAGGLLGALNDDEWLWPLGREVQDAEYVARLVHRTFNAQEGPAEEIEPFRTAQRTALYRFLDEATEGAATALGPFGHVTVTALRDIDAREVFVRAWRLETETGQTVHIKRSDKGRGGHPRWIRSEPDRTPSEPPRGGLVLKVADMKASRDFYAEVLGLEVTRSDNTYVTFAGWLVIEPDRRSEVPLDGMTGASSAALRFYLRPGPMSFVARALLARNMRCTDVERDGKTVMVTADPDGNTVELHVRNGHPVPMNLQGREKGG